MERAKILMIKRSAKVFKFLSFLFFKFFSFEILVFVNESNEEINYEFAKDKSVALKGIKVLKNFIVYMTVLWWVGHS